VRSWLISQLTLKAKEGDDALRRLNAFDWLVWEPGQWRPSRANTETALGLPIGNLVQQKEGEALVVQLAPKPDKKDITLGRAGCDIVIDDRTLSTHHLSFSFDEHHWWVHDVGSRNGSLINGRKLGTEPVRLTAGTRLAAAQVMLTFYTSDAMFQRLKTGLKL
jgi:pSer/pThr/pTyr-binding forkhead associated (FHA) protein